MKLSAATMTQKKLIWRPAGAGSSAVSATVARAAPPSTARRSTLGALGLLQHEGGDGDDDREDAEAFRERGAEDELGADRRRRVGVAPDRRRGEAGQDADADARADDPEGREAGADCFHVLLLLLVAPGALPGVMGLVDDVTAPPLSERVGRAGWAG